METQYFEFYSEGSKLQGMTRVPDEWEGKEPLPTIIHPTGFLGLASAPVVDMYHDKFTEGGFAVVGANYRGFGESEGESGWIHPERQLEDLLNLMTYVFSNPEQFDGKNMFCYGHGGTGGGNAVILAAVDRRIRAVAAQTAVADGAAWLRSMRTESEWQAYLRRLAANEVRRIQGEPGAMVDPREEIMVATPERRSEPTRAFTDSRTGKAYFLASANRIVRYRPIDFVKRIAPRPILLISLEGDVVTPPDIGTDALFEAAGAPKKLIRQVGGLSHYEAYRTNLDRISAEVLAWFSTAMSVDNFDVQEVRK